MWYWIIKVENDRGTFVFTLVHGLELANSPFFCHFIQNQLRSEAGIPQKSRATKAYYDLTGPPENV